MTSTRVIIGLLMAAVGFYAITSMKGDGGDRDLDSTAQVVSKTGGEDADAGSGKPSVVLKAEPPKYSDTGLEFVQPEGLSIKMQKLAEQVSDASLEDRVRVRALKALSYNSHRLEKSMLESWIQSNCPDIRSLAMLLLAKNGSSDAQWKLLDDVRAKSEGADLGIRALASHAKDDLFSEFMDWAESEADRRQLAILADFYVGSVKEDPDRLTGTVDRYLNLVVSRPTSAMLGSAATLVVAGHVRLDEKESQLSRLSDSSRRTLEARIDSLEMGKELIKKHSGKTAEVKDDS